MIGCCKSVDKFLPIVVKNFKMVWLLSLEILYEIVFCILFARFYTIEEPTY